MKTGGVKKLMRIFMAIIIIVSVIGTITDMVRINKDINSGEHSRGFIQMDISKLNEVVDTYYKEIRYNYGEDTLYILGGDSENYIVTGVFKEYHEGNIVSEAINNIIKAELTNVKLKPLSRLFGVIMTFVIYGVIIYALIYVLGGGFKGGGVGTSIAGIGGMNTSNKLAESSPGLDDIRGHDEIKEDIESVVDFIRDPKRYTEMGARLPKGVLLYGPPGTGKTMIAKAIAKDSGVEFLTVTGSDFNEMYVGVGARRVRDLFKEARKKAPSIIFIDEIDALGGHRRSENNSEKANTLNALLAEIDGFNSEDDGVFVLASTNMLEELDVALTRSGRLEKHIAVNLPDKKGREDILELYMRGKEFGEGVTKEYLTDITMNFSGADIETFLNQATIESVRGNKKVIDMGDIDVAIYSLMLNGRQKKNYLRSDEENRIVAYHEAGHTVVSILLAGETVSKVTIIPSTSGAGGVTFMNNKENSLMTKESLENRLRMIYAGRAAEYVMTGDEGKVTTGAHNDIEKATSIIYRMVTEYGMFSEYGLINRNIISNRPSEKVEKIVKEMSTKYYEETKEYLSRPEILMKLNKLADVLMDKETLTEADINEIVL